MAIAIRLDNIVNYLANQNPFIYSCLQNINRVQDENTEVPIQVTFDSEGFDYWLVFNNRKFQALMNFKVEYDKVNTQPANAIQWCAAYVEHELYHLMLQHPLTIEGYADKDVAGMAFDIYINLKIGRNNFFPERFKKQFPDFYSIFHEDVVKFIPDLKTDGDTFYYYSELLKLKKDLNQKNDSGGDMSDEEKDMMDALNGKGDEENEDKNEDGEGQGEGECEGQGDKDSNGQGQGKGKQGKTKKNPYNMKPNHNWEKHSGKTNEIQKGALSDKAVEILERNEGMMPGNMRGEFSEIIERHKKATKPTYDYKKFIDRMVTTAINNDSKRRKTSTKINKRSFSSSYGECTLPGSKAEKKGRLAVAIDTSGSCTAGFLSIAFTDVDKYLTKVAEVKLLQVDTELRLPVETYKRGAEMKAYGRGGTNFQPAIDWCYENDVKYLIYFTDGECYPPKYDPEKKLYLLWVTINTYKPDMSDHGGQHVHVDYNEYNK